MKVSAVHSVGMRRAWNNWYHCNGNTYGTWLRGDPRGFRERRHRRHIEGDYHNPPPAGQYERLYRRSKDLLKAEPVYLDAMQQHVAAEAIVSRLLRDGIEVIALAVDDHHFHLLARFPDHRPKHWIGLAKKHASFLLGDCGLPGQVWTRGSRALPITDRAHQLSAYGYIIAHRKTRAAVWTFRDAPPNAEDTTPSE